MSSLLSYHSSTVERGLIRHLSCFTVSFRVVQKDIFDSLTEILSTDTLLGSSGLR